MCMQISESAAKKLGEVLAFAVVGSDTFTKAGTAYAELFSEKEFDTLQTNNKSHAANLQRIAEDLQVTEIVEKKLGATSEKLKKMRDLYVGDDWDDPIEMMEWAGFFEGAAIVHWSLIQGFAIKADLMELKVLSEDALEYHTKLLEKSKEELSQSAKNL